MPGPASTHQRNVLGGPIAPCSTNPMTGAVRDGCCTAVPFDPGQHFICAELSDAFLEYTRSSGNDLSTPIPALGFPGLKAGDRWCLCVERWLEAYRAGIAPRVILASTNKAAPAVVSLEVPARFAVDQPTAPSGAAARR